MKRRFTYVAVAGAASIAGAFGLLGSTSALAATSGPITGLAGKCVDVAGGSSADHTAVQLYDCNGTSAQSWTAGNSDNTLRALGKCMGVTGGATANGSKIDIYDCNGTTGEEWTPSNGELFNVASGKCLDATDNSSANGNQLQIWTCTGTANQLWNLPTGGGTPPGGGLDTSVAPGGNFDLGVWELQEPIGSPGSPTTIPSSSLQGANGFQDSYFSTDGSDGAMTFWAPEKGVTTPNSNYARSELREMNRDGSAADWSLSGTHRLDATLRVVSVTSNVCVGQIHLGSGGTSTKPLLELYYHSNGDIVVGLENSPDGGQTTHTVGNVPVGTKWSYSIGESGGSSLTLSVNGSTTSYGVPSSFSPYKQYFKAGSYNQSSSDSTTNGARVGFYALNVTHS
ncbi:Ricin-type beta-trefoil lectin domain-containing protein [Actinacidiphila yanglinensis]|uniref:Ricin-type beta-trefoil lectin domain-containing protein n=2 Tax=Actinacidiphila yanglinensis TaxID=310779 RepID=A0A1H6C010_9ACTN|nr:Ricin-type beta-trefoil lectin domain-containing protein [Actinacidiphila yanglinensis]